jgi:hypothetical protein
METAAQESRSRLVIGQLRCNRIQITRFTLNCIGNDGHLLLRFVTAAILYRLTDARHRLDAITGVPTRRIQHVLHPWTTWQTIGVQELALSTRQISVD